MWQKQQPEKQEKATTSDMEAKYKCYVMANALNAAYRAALKGDWSCFGPQHNIGKGLGMQQAARRSRMSYKESSDEISEPETAAWSF